MENKNELHTDEMKMVSGGNGKVKVSARIDAAKCVGCQSCITACPKEAISFNGKFSEIDFALCNGCAEEHGFIECDLVCQFGAVKIIRG